MCQNVHVADALQERKLVKLDKAAGSFGHLIRTIDRAAEKLRQAVEAEQEPQIIAGLLLTACNAAEKYRALGLDDYSKRREADDAARHRHMGRLLELAWTKPRQRLERAVRVAAKVCKLSSSHSPVGVKLLKR